ncbi:MAG: hypothetical protein K9M45_02500 [Kiritimatiellales bacterium]|nr:hypothetical protein [Kiritimatiellales bacterium]
MSAKVMLIGAVVIGCVSLGAVAAGESNRNYTYIYFENGYPTRVRGNRRPPDMDNILARENPDLVIQTGFYSLRMDCDTMQLSGYDVLQGSDYITALNEDVTKFSPAKLSLRIDKDGVGYTCTSGIVQDKKKQYVRLIESGRFVQRFDHMGLVFTAANGDVLEKAGRLEVTAWPDHVVFNLDFTGVEGVTKAGIQLISPAGKIHRSAVIGNQALLALQPHLDRTYEPLDGTGIKCVFDREEFGLRFDLPIDEVKFPSDTNRVDEFVIEVRNPSKEARNIPLIFNEIKPQAITGTSMVLCESDGRPAGIPVQVSKNWHRKPDQRITHEGPWLRGYAMVPLAAGETKRFRLRVVTGYWGGVAAVSYSQLCVIGYAGNWKWDESALGCWGESMCYDPTQHLGSSFIADVRPAFTISKNGRTHEWTENVGGGDFLIYFDSSNTYRWTKRLKTAYRWTGPNMTEVLYSGVTDNEKIRFNYRIRSVRTADYHRRFHAFKYEFLQDVVSPERLVFHQMAADYYSSVEFDRHYIGDQNGLRSTHAHETDMKGYAGSPIPFDHSWLAIDDTVGGGDAAKARRGILSLSSTLNGKAFASCLHRYSPGKGRELFDLSSDSVCRSYSAGDVVAGELEVVLPPKSIEVYWGTDREFTKRLKTYGTNAWQAVADEYRHNSRLSVTMHKGTLRENYPVEIQAAQDDGAVFADFTINRGGIGHVPVVLQGAPIGSALSVERHLTGKWVPLGPEAYYQGIRNAQGKLDCVFNIDRPSSDLNRSWRIRILKTALTE